MNLKLARIKKGIKQIDLARMGNVSPSTLIRWEKGKDIDNIKLGTMKKISKALETDINELFFSDEE